MLQRWLQLDPGGGGRLRTLAFWLVVAASLGAFAIGDAQRSGGHGPGSPSLLVAAANHVAEIALDAPPSTPPPQLPDTIGWLAVGGGAEPASNQVSMEQDLALARDTLRDTLGGDGVILFGGGAGRAPVQVVREETPAPSLAQRLGDLFAPRAGRATRYRATRLVPHGPATAERTLELLTRALGAAGQPPLLVFIATHGEPGDSPRTNLIRLWGGAAIGAEELAAELDAGGGARPLRLVMASCYSGGFAEIAFERGDEAAGPARADRCGLFATTWEREASGCDPNPDRRRQESYGLHFFQALRGRDKQGRPLAIEELDFDGDGAVSLLEAHARVRIASRSISVPTTTSERWLRHASPPRGPKKSLELPEERAVITALAGALRLPTAESATARLAHLEAALQLADDELAELEGRLDAAWTDLRIALLERWPVLDDPHHPDHAPTLARDGAAIEHALERSPPARAYHHLSERTGRAERVVDNLDQELAMVERLVRAHENVELAERLHALGGPKLAHFERLRSCERTVPAARR